MNALYDIRGLVVRAEGLCRAAVPDINAKLHWFEVPDDGLVAVEIVEDGLVEEPIPTVANPHQVADEGEARPARRLCRHGAHQRPLLRQV